MPAPDPTILRFDAAAACDALHPPVRPASILLSVSPAAGPDGFHSRILAIDRPDLVSSHPAAPHARIVSRPNCVLLPGLVNAHAHLDLTHIGPQPHDPARGFVPWVDMIRSRRLADEAEIAASVRRGIALSLAGGTVAIGDIAGAPRARSSLTPFRELGASPLRGVSFLEFFGIGSARERYRDWLPALLDAVPHSPSARIRLGLQPHAPNTVALSEYRWAAARGLPLSTHLAESLEERLFISSAQGPHRQLLEKVGVWCEDVLLEVGRGAHPVEHMAQTVQQRSWICAHVNDCPDAALDVLAKNRTPVAYCPRASAYFSAHSHFGPHRYRDMISAGIPVCLGTDSIVNLPTQGLSILDEMRFLHSRDRTDPILLLRMATISGAAALGLPTEPFTFAAGKPLAGLVSVPIANSSSDPLGAALTSAARPEILWIDNDSRQTGNRIDPIVSRAGSSVNEPEMDSKQALG